jgi:hypothetical protein
MMPLAPGDESHRTLEHHVEGLHEHRRTRYGCADVLRGHKLPLEASLLAERPSLLGLRMVGHEGRAVDELLYPRREEVEVAHVLYDLGASPSQSHTQGRKYTESSLYGGHEGAGLSHVSDSHLGAQLTQGFRSLRTAHEGPVLEPRSEELLDGRAAYPIRRSDNQNLSVFR